MMTVTKRSLVCAFIQNCWLGIPALVSSSAVGSVVCVHPFSRSFSNIGRSVGSRYFTVLPKETNDSERSNNQYQSEQAREIARQKRYIETYLPCLIRQNRIPYEMGVKIKDGTLPLFMAYDLVKSKLDAVLSEKNRKNKGSYPNFANLTRAVEGTAVPGSHQPRTLKNELQNEVTKYQQTSRDEIRHFQHKVADEGKTASKDLVDKISSPSYKTKPQQDPRRLTTVVSGSQKTSSGSATADIASNSSSHPAGVAIPPKENSKILRSDDPSQIYLRFCLEDVGTVDDVYRATLNAAVSFPHDRRPKIQQFFHFGQTQNRSYVPHEQDNVLVQTIHTAASGKDWIKYPVNLEEIMKAACIALCGQNWSVFNGNVIYFHQNIVGKGDQFISRMQTRIPSTPFGDVRLSASLDPHCVYPFMKGFLDGALAISGSPKAPSTVKLNIFTGKMLPKKTDQFLKNEEQPDIYQQFLNVEPQHLTFLTRQALAALFHAYSTNKKGDDSLTVKQSIHITE